MLNKKKLLLIIFIFINIKAKNIYIVPFNGYSSESFFNSCKPFGDLRYKLKLNNINLIATSLDTELIDPAGLIVTDTSSNLDLKKLNNNNKFKKILILLEPPTVMPQYYDCQYHEYFDKIFILFDNFIDNKKYFKLYFPQDSLELKENNIEFKNRKFCTAIFSNKYSIHPLELYSERKNIINFFEKNCPQDFEFYGYNWPANIYKTYKNAIPNKHEIIKNYKFCIAYENMHSNLGYFTEKIFDVFISVSVPVYLGAKNISDFIPKDCFISRADFKSDQELYNFLKSITEEQYNNYLDNIKKFLKSPKAKYFSCDYFVETIIKALDT